jgi:DNA-binding winged helix-turn-helix (wHTH) protein
MTLRFSDFVFDGAARLLTRHGDPVHLSPRTFKLLEALLEAHPRALSKKELIRALWADVVVEEGNLKTTVSDLRNALGDPDLIRTVQRYGYAFAGEPVRDTLPTRPYRLYGDGIRVSITRAEAIIGRHPGCDVCIDSPDISRHHAKIRVQPDGVTIEDLGSKNGTWVGASRLAEPRELQDGDRIRVADVLLVFRSGVGDSPTRSRTDTPP